MCVNFTWAEGEVKKNTEVLEENAGPSSAEGADIGECTIPLVVFSASGQEEDALAEKKDEECSEDCESFHPADLMSFAWQIARGMVSKTCKFPFLNSIDHIIAVIESAVFFSYSGIMWL